MLKKMHIVTEPELWWIANKKQIRKDHTMHRNNTIKNIHFKFKGMCPVTLFSLCDHFCTHLLICQRNFVESTHGRYFC